MESVIIVHTVTIVSGELENDLRSMRIVREEVAPASVIRHGC